MTESKEEPAKTLDHAFEYCVTLIAIISAALYKHAGSNIEVLPTYMESIPQALNVLFLPFFIVIPLWIYKLVTTSQKKKMVLRFYLWNLIALQSWLIFWGFILQSGYFISIELPTSILIPALWLVYFSIIIPLIPAAIIRLIFSAYEKEIPPEKKVHWLLRTLLFSLAYGTFWLMLMYAGSL